MHAGCVPLFIYHLIALLVTKCIMSQLPKLHCLDPYPLDFTMQEVEGWLSLPLLPANNVIRHLLSTNLHDHQIALIPHTQQKQTLYDYFISLVCGAISFLRIDLQLLSR
jgi:hypothetical protein